MQPLIEELAAAFVVQHPNVQINVQGGGSALGIQSVGEGTADVGMASRGVEPSELVAYPHLQTHTIAWEAIAIVVHPEVPIDGLTLAQVQGIFAGEITNWRQVGGHDAPILVYSYEEGTGTRGLFEQLVMGGAVITDTPLSLSGYPRPDIATKPNVIGFFFFCYVDEGAKVLDIDGVAPTEANVISGAYPIARPLNLVTNGKPSGVVKAWFDFILSDKGQAIVAEAWYIPAKNLIRVVGSPCVEHLADRLARSFVAQQPGVEIDIQGGGNTPGIEYVGENLADVGMTCRSIQPDERRTHRRDQSLVGLCLQPRGPSNHSRLGRCSFQVKRLANRWPGWASIGPITTYLAGAKRTSVLQYGSTSRAQQGDSLTQGGM